MLTPLSHLLAENSDSSIKFIFGAIVVVIWIVGGIMSQMKKKADRERWNNPQPQQDWSHLLRDLTAGQSKPYTPSTPAPPPIISPQAPRYQPAHRQAPQPTKSFVQQSPRPFVQQYRPPQAPQRPARIPQKSFQPPKPIQRKPKPQRRPPAIPARAVQAAPPIPQQSHGGIQDAIISMGPIPGQGGAMGIQSSTNASRHAAGPRLTSAQLRKLIVWSEVLALPLSLRENSPK